MLDLDPLRPPSTPRDASTVLLLRDAREGFEVLMVRRHSRSGFMGGAHVFPGGKVDDADGAREIVSRVVGRSGDDAARALGEEDPRRAVALFVAAIRETFEEAGLLLGELAASADLAAARASGAPFAEVLARLDARPTLDALVPQARWVTPTAESRRFDARFFLARAPVGQTASHDARETTEHHWLTPRAALERGERGEIVLPPPTLCSLEWLADFATIDAALAAAAVQPPRRIEPVFVATEAVPTLALPGDPLHADRAPALPGPTRVVLRDGRWRREAAG